MFPPKIGSDIFERFPCCFSTSLSWSSNFTPYINSLIWIPTNISSLILASLILGNFFFKYINPALFWSIALKKFFIRPSLMCHGGNCTFSGLIRGVFTICFSPGISDSRVCHCYLDVMMISVPPLPLTHKATKLRVMNLQAKQDDNDLISLQMFQ